jgi:HK97 family phage major capsid protein
MAAFPTVVNQTTYDQIITRPNATALIPAPVTDSIISGITERSAFMSMATRLPNMSSKTLTMPVLSALPTAYFVTGEAGDGTNLGLKQATHMAWGTKIITAEEIAVLVPIPQNVLDDSSYDIWGNVRDKAVEAFGLLIDNAAIFNSGAPASWPVGIAAGAAAASNKIVRAALGDLADDIGGPSGLMSKVEGDGYDCNGFYGDISMKAALRGVRDTNKGLIFQPSMTAGTPSTLYGQPIMYARNGVTMGTSLLIGGDWKQAVYSIRQDMTVKLLTEGVITDATGAIQFNLGQQDMVALRLTMRLGWQLPNPINRLNGTDGTRYPFAVLTSA